MSNLTTFIAQIKTKGLARSNRFRVEIPIAQSILSIPNSEFSPSSNGDMMLYCDSVQLPGMNYSTTQNRSYGEFREIPYDRLFDNINLTFYVDSDMKVKRFFDTWMSTIVNPNDRTFGYYTDYCVNSKIYVNDMEDNTTHIVNLYECYPKTIGSIQMDYASREIIKLNVTMSYKYWN